jgi:hypothetical protein
MTHLEEHFNEFICLEYNIDSILKETVSRKNGIFDFKTNSIIIKVLDTCYEKEIEMQPFLIEHIELSIIDSEVKLLSVLDYKKSLNKNDFHYTFKMEVENNYISLLVSKINALKVWVNNKTVLELQQPINSDGTTSMFDLNREKFKGFLSKFNFFELEKVKIIPDDMMYKLIELIEPKEAKQKNKNISYAIAMFDYLDFFVFLEENHFSNKRDMHKEISKWFESDKDGRRIRGNINSLLNRKEAYISCKYKEQVIKDYKNII